MLRIDQKECAVMSDKLTEWQVVRNIVLFFWLVALLGPYAAFDSGEVLSVILFFIFVLPSLLYFIKLHKNYKKTSFKSFDAYFTSIKAD